MQTKKNNNFTTGTYRINSNSIETLVSQTTINWIVTKIFNHMGLINRYICNYFTRNQSYPSIILSLAGLTLWGFPCFADMNRNDRLRRAECKVVSIELILLLCSVSPVTNVKFSIPQKAPLRDLLSSSLKNIMWSSEVITFKTVTSK